MCEIEFMRVPGNEKAWLEKQKELKSRVMMGLNGALPSQKTANVQKAKEFSQILKTSKSSDNTGEISTSVEDSTIISSKCKNTVPMQNGEQKKTNAEYAMNKNVLPQTLITRNVKEPIKGSGMNEIEKSTKNRPTVIDGDVTLLPAWTQQLKHVNEEISRQTNLLDSSAKLLYSQMEAVKGNPVDVVNYSQGIVNLMRAKTETIKATTEIIKTIKEMGE
jgi:hypothetical protein